MESHEFHFIAPGTPFRVKGGTVIYLKWNDWQAMPWIDSDCLIDFDIYRLKDFKKDQKVILVDLDIYNPDGKLFRRTTWGMNPNDDYRPCNGDY